MMQDLYPDAQPPLDGDMNTYDNAYRLLRLALYLVEHTCGAFGIFCFCLSFLTRIGAIYALLFLSLATVIELTAPRKTG